MKKTTRPELNQERIASVFSELSPAGIQESLRERCRNAALSFCAAMLEAEVQKLCGTPFARKGEALCWRGGSEHTTVLVERGKERIRRPRVRRADGEVQLETLEKLQDQDLLDDQMREAMLLGLSTRNYERVVNGYAKKLGTSKSSVSRAFKRASQKELDIINTGRLDEEFVAIVLDGIEIAGTMIVAALGITSDLKKVPIGLREGDSENSEVVKDLLSSLIERGFTLHCEKLLVILDGSKALKKGVRAVFGERVLIQRCWLHKARNICAYLPKTYHGQVNWRMKKLMALKSLSEAKQEYASFHRWLSDISEAAASSLDEAGDELLTVHAFGVTGQLRKSLVTTNIIESLFSVARVRIARNKRYRLSSKQRIRWLAAIVLEHHRDKMRRLRGVEQAPALIRALGKDIVRKAA